MKGMAHPNSAIIDLDALIYNLGSLHNHLKGHSRIIAVVKANAYGHGAVPITRALEASGVGFFAVAFVDEGIELRRAGIRSPILVMGGFFKEQVGDLFEYKLTPVIFHFDHLDWLASELKGREDSLAVHVKVDTGMGRLGLPPREVLLLVKKLRKLPGLSLEGLMSHFSDKDPHKSPAAQEQIRLFEKVREELKAEGIQIPLHHLANSSAIFSLEESWYSGVRPGISLYGYAPSHKLENVLSLKPVLSLKCRITHLRKVPAGTKISYGGTFITQRETMIVVLPIGYADGFPRALSNRGAGLIKGRRAPIVGNICMDMIVLDVTNIPDIKMGDEVVLIGRQGDEMISAVELAEKIETIPYEILSAIGKRIPRIYKGIYGGESAA